MNRLSTSLRSRRSGRLPPSCARRESGRSSGNRASGPAPRAALGAYVFACEQLDSQAPRAEASSIVRGAAAGCMPARHAEASAAAWYRSLRPAGCVPCADASKDTSRCRGTRVPRSRHTLVGGLLSAWRRPLQPCASQRRYTHATQGDQARLTACRAAVRASTTSLYGQRRSPAHDGEAASSTAHVSEVDGEVAHALAISVPRPRRFLRPALRRGGGPSDNPRLTKHCSM